MKEYTLVVSGCDDATYATLTLTDEEYYFLKAVVDKVNANSYTVCEPNMYFQEDDE
jgi:hypothetical protein